jgi:hypothetical protein
MQTPLVQPASIVSSYGQAADNKARRPRTICDIYRYLITLGFLDLLRP